MFNRFLRVSTSNGEQRWINLDRVTRVSLAEDAGGDAVLIFSFDGGDRVKIHGTDDESRALVKRITSSLDSAALGAGMLRAA